MLEGVSVRPTRQRVRSSPSYWASGTTSPRRSSTTGCAQGREAPSRPSTARLGLLDEAGLDALSARSRASSAIAAECEHHHHHRLLELSESSSSPTTTGPLSSGSLVRTASADRSHRLECPGSAAPAAGASITSAVSNLGEVLGVLAFEVRLELVAAGRDGTSLEPHDLVTPDALVLEHDLRSCRRAAMERQLHSGASVSTRR